MNKSITITGIVFVLLAIILGAMAAHSLEGRIAENEIAIFEKGVRYQMYMGLGLMIVGFSANRIVLPLKTFWIVALLGVILFSGGLYLWAFNKVAAIPSFIVHIIPFGGLLMITAWIILLVKIAKQKAT